MVKSPHPFSDHQRELGGPFGGSRRNHGKCHTKFWEDGGLATNRNAVTMLISIVDSNYQNLLIEMLNETKVNGGLPGRQVSTLYAVGHPNHVWWFYESPWTRWEERILRPPAKQMGTQLHT